MGFEQWPQNNTESSEVVEQVVSENVETAAVENMTESQKDTENLKTLFAGMENRKFRYDAKKRAVLEFDENNFQDIAGEVNISDEAKAVFKNAWNTAAREFFIDPMKMVKEGFYITPAQLIEKLETAESTFDPQDPRWTQHS